MSISTIDNIVQGTGNGVATTVNFNKKVFASSQLVVKTRVIATGAIATQVENGAGTYDYTVSVAGDFSSATITWNNALPATHEYTVERIMPLTQEEVYPEADPFPAQSHEDALDKLTMIMQQLVGDLNRSIQMDSTLQDIPSSLKITENATDRADSFIGFNAAGDLALILLSNLSSVAASVDEADTDTTKNKLLSNFLAKGWEDLRVIMYGGSDGDFVIGGTAPSMVGQGIGTVSVANPSSYAVLLANQGKVHNISGTTGTLVMPDMTGVTKRVKMRFRHAGTSTVLYTLDGNGSDTMNGASTYLMGTNGQTTEWEWDGTSNWELVNASGPIFRQYQNQTPTNNTYGPFRMECGRSDIVASGSVTNVSQGITFGTAFTACLGIAVVVDGTGFTLLTNIPNANITSLSASGASLYIYSNDGTSNLIAATYEVYWMAWGY